MLKAGTPFFVKHYVNMQAWGVYGWMVQGSYTLDGVTLLTSAGMGLRCDYCKGTVLIKVNFNVLTNDAVFFNIYIYIYITTVLMGRSPCVTGDGLPHPCSFEIALQR